MTWFKVDDNLALHAKAVAAGNPAMGLWVRAGSWAAQQLTEGFIPAAIAATLGSRAEARRLVEVKLWVDEPGGYRFWQWAEDGRQPTRETVEADRAANRERQRRARDRARESRRDSAVSHGAVTGAVTVPPTRPDPTRSSVETLGGESLETLRPGNAAAAPPPPRCPRHPNGNPDDQPCGGCRDARRVADQRAEQAIRDQAGQRSTAARLDAEARSAAVRRCQLCDGDGRLPAGSVCDHDPNRAARAAAGVAAARAALGRRLPPADQADEQQAAS